MKQLIKNIPVKFWKNQLPGPSFLSLKEDIYYSAKEEADIDPETKLRKALSPPSHRPNEINNMKDMSGEDLDIPEDML